MNLKQFIKYVSVISTNNFQEKLNIGVALELVLVYSVFSSMGDMKKEDNFEFYRVFG